MTVHLTSHGPVRVVTIDRPEVRNAVDAQTAASLLEAVSVVESDDEALVGVLTGTGDTFCSGWDLRTIDATGADYDPKGEPALRISRLTPSKPFIAAIEGHAVAGGLELALWCDLRVVSETAVFGVFCRRWGVPLIDGGTVRLPRIVGHGRAIDMILTGRPVAATEALEWGLANRVVGAGQALGAAVALAEQIASFPQVCMRADRASAISQWGLPLEDALSGEAHGGVAPLTGEAVAGAARFVAGAGRGGSFERPGTS